METYVLNRIKWYSFICGLPMLKIDKLDNFFDAADNTFVGG